MKKRPLQTQIMPIEMIQIPFLPVQPYLLFMLFSKKQRKPPKNDFLLSEPKISGKEGTNARKEPRNSLFRKHLKGG